MIRAFLMGHSRGRDGRSATLTLLAMLRLAGPAARASRARRRSWPASRPPTGKITDLQAEFTQVANNKSLGQDIKAEGTVYLKKGGKMRWDYKSPSPQQIVSDGTSLWVYTPELNQVNKGDAPKALAGPAGSFLAGLGQRARGVHRALPEPAAKTDGAGRHVLDLTPKNPTPLLTRLVLTIDPKDYIVRQAVLYDQLQQHRDHALSPGSPSTAGLADTLCSRSRRPRARRWCRSTRASRPRPRQIEHGRREQLRHRLQGRTCRRSPTPSTRRRARSRPATTSRARRTRSSRRRWTSCSPSADDMKLKAVLDILQSKLHRRGIDLKALTIRDPEPAAGGTLQASSITLQDGIPMEKAKEIVRLIKDSKIRVQASIQEKQVRVSGKNRDDLQAVIALVKAQGPGRRAPVHELPVRPERR